MRTGSCEGVQVCGWCVEVVAGVTEVVGGVWKS